METGDTLHDARPDSRGPDEAQQLRQLSGIGDDFARSVQGDPATAEPLNEFGPHEMDSTARSSGSLLPNESTPPMTRSPMSAPEDAGGVCVDVGKQRLHVG